MEMLAIALVAIIAFAVVLVPLFRRRAGVSDEPNAEAAPLPRDTDPSAGTGVVPPMAAGPASPVAPAPTDDTVFAELPPAQPGDDSLEREVLRYRDAVRAGTVCRKCGQANPADSAYCSECGAPLPRGDAKEFE